MANAKSNKRIKYTPVNMQKYRGSVPLILKSNWEVEFAVRMCDMNPSCIEWSYEPEAAKIFYLDPLTQSTKPYKPDFLITYLTTGGGVKRALIEIKPMHEALAEHLRDRADALAHMRNIAKWQAAAQWCMRRGIDFKVMTEAELFVGHSRAHKPKRPYKPKSRK